MTKISEFLEIIYVEINGTVKVKGIKAVTMSTNVYLLGVRNGKQKFSRFETVSAAFFATSKSSSVKSALTRVKKATTIGEAEKALQSAEKNFSEVKSYVSQAIAAAEVESVGAEPDVVANLQNAVKAARLAFQNAEGAVSEARNLVEAMRANESPAPIDDDSSSIANPVAGNHLGDDEEGRLAAAYGLEKIGVSFYVLGKEKYVYLPESKKFMSLAPVTRLTGEAFTGEPVLPGLHSPKYLQEMLGSLNARVPAESELNEFFALLNRATGSDTLEGILNVTAGHIITSNQLYVNAEGKFYTREYGYIPFTVRAPYTISTRKVLVGSEE